MDSPNDFAEGEGTWATEPGVKRIINGRAYCGEFKVSYELISKIKYLTNYCYEIASCSINPLYPSETNSSRIAKILI